MVRADYGEQKKVREHVSYVFYLTIPTYFNVGLFYLPYEKNNRIGYGLPMVLNHACKQKFNQPTTRQSNKRRCGL